MKVFIILLISSCIIKQIMGQATLSVEKGENAVLQCVLSGVFTLPLWRAPSNDKITNQDDATLNPNLQIVQDNRVEYRSNQKDLILKSIQDSDGGVYTCTHSTLGTYSINLDVKPVTTTTTDGRYNCTGMEDSEVIDTEEECICIWTFIGIFLSLAVYIMSSMVVGCCLYFCEESCCCDVDDQLPSWMQKWWQKVIFVGILIVYLIWKSCTGSCDRRPPGGNPGPGPQRGDPPHGQNNQNDTGSRGVPNLSVPFGGRVNGRQGDNNKGKGSSAATNSEEHPLTNTVTPSQKAGSLDPLPKRKDW